MTEQSIIQLDGDRAFAVTHWSVLHRLKRANKMTDEWHLCYIPAMSESSAQIKSIQHRSIQVNGIKMHIAEQGKGPLVVLAHGWPELWYSWRHVLPALAAAGYHVVAPDMRGDGQTDAPPNMQDYTQFQFVGDVVGLVHTLGHEQAVIAGHDLGAMVAHNAAILRPDIFRAVILLSVPYGARTEGAVKPTEGMRKRAPEGQQFYQIYFQTPGIAEKGFDADPKRTLRMFLYSLCGSIPKEHKWRYMFGVNEKALDGCVDPKQLPAWLKPEDLDYYANEYSRTGFRGGLNWYRGQDIFWQETPFLIGCKLMQPTLYVGGTDDAVVEFARPYVDNLEKSVPNLWNKVLLPGVGHWTEQEAPTEVNRLMVDFLDFLGSVDSRKRSGVKDAFLLGPRGAPASPGESPLYLADTPDRTPGSRSMWRCNENRLCQLWL